MSLYELPLYDYDIVQSAILAGFFKLAMHVTYPWRDFELPILALVLALRTPNSARR